MIPLMSASQVAGITGMSHHQCPARKIHFEWGNTESFWRNETLELALKDV
jgi:hypothetical protein